MGLPTWDRCKRGWAMHLTPFIPGTFSPTISRGGGWGSPNLSPSQQPCVTGLGGERMTYPKSSSKLCGTMMGFCFYFLMCLFSMTKSGSPATAPHPAASPKYCSRFLQEPQTPPSFTSFTHASGGSHFRPDLCRSFLPEPGNSL